MKVYIILAFFILAQTLCMERQYNFTSPYATNTRDLYTTTTKNSKTIVYSKSFDLDNNITGTGNKLEDIAYNSVCEGLQCQSGCCEGIINSMTCGSPDNCKKYYAYKRMIKIITIVFVIAGALFFFWVMSCCQSKKGDCKGKACDGLLVVIFLIFLPIIIIYLIFKKCFKNCGEDSARKYIYF